MALIQNAVAIAEQELRNLNPELLNSFTQILQFYRHSPESLPKKLGKQPTGGVEHIKSLVQSYHKARQCKRPGEPQTVPDPLVSFILQHWYNVLEQHLEDARKEHQLAMAAENMVGDLLERYLAQILEPTGWIWCAGSIVKSVDFIKPPLLETDIWTELQVKNRNNSENSSSSAIRNGTMIQKWHRTNSKTGNTNWQKFPDEQMRANLSEDGFRAFVQNHIQKLKAE